jgi:hypothetical protein
MNEGQAERSETQNPDGADICHAPTKVMNAEELQQETTFSLRALFGRSCFSVSFGVSFGGHLGSYLRRGFARDFAHNGCSYVL